MLLLGVLVAPTQYALPTENGNLILETRVDS